jgi:Phage integrase family
MTSWRSAWRSLRRAAGLRGVRFHDGRHTALTRLAEAGQPDWVIQAQIGHVSPAMMKTYSHIRRMALDKAAAVLEPAFEFKKAEPVPPSVEDGATDEALTSQITSQSDDLPSDIAEILKESGSSGWTRTSNPPVNSRKKTR